MNNLVCALCKLSKRVKRRVNKKFGEVRAYIKSKGKQYGFIRSSK